MERVFTVEKFDKLAVCQIIISEAEAEEMNHLNTEQIKKIVQERAAESDTWTLIESEEAQFYEVTED